MCPYTPQVIDTDPCVLTKHRSQKVTHGKQFFISLFCLSAPFFPGREISKFKLLHEFCLLSLFYSVLSVYNTSFLCPTHQNTFYCGTKFYLILNLKTISSYSTETRVLLRDKLSEYCNSFWQFVVEACPFSSWIIQKKRNWMGNTGWRGRKGSEEKEDKKKSGKNK